MNDGSGIFRHCLIPYLWSVDFVCRIPMKNRQSWFGIGKKYTKRPNTSQKRSNLADRGPILHNGGPILYIVQGFDLTSCWGGWGGEMAI